MKEQFENMMNTITQAAQASQNARANANAAANTPESAEVARIHQETQLQTAKMAMSMVKKLIISAIIVAVLAICAAIGVGVFTMNKVSDMQAESHHNTERMMDKALNSIW